MKSLFVIVLFICFLEAGCIWMANKTNLFTINSIQFAAPNLPLLYQEYDFFKKRVETHLQSIAGKSIWSVSIKSLLETIKKENGITGVNIRRIFPDKLEISFIPHKIVLIYLNEGRGRQNLIPIASDSSLLHAWPLEKPPDVPILIGKQFLENYRLRKMAVDLINHLPKDGPLALSNIVEVGIQPVSGLWMSLNEGDFTIFLGEENFLLKLDNVEKVINYLSSYGIKKRVIDASYGKKVVVRISKE